MSKSATSFIEHHEVEEAKEIIKQNLGFEPFRPTGNHMAVKLYIREDEVRTFIDKKGRKTLIAMPDSFSVNDQFKTCVALVIALGPECFIEEKYKEIGPPCRVGDWIIIPRNDKSTQINYRGVPMHLIPCDRVQSVVEDPSYVTRD